MSRRSALVALALAGGVLPLAALPAGAAAPTDPSRVGRFAAPFQEPTADCKPRKDAKQGDAREQCKPAGATVAVLPNGKLVYWDALQGIQDAQVSAVAEFGDDAENDMARVLDLRGSGPVWEVTDPDPAGAPEGQPGEYLPGPLHNDDASDNDADLFCSDQVWLADGRLLDAGGTHYYQEPGVPGNADYGVVELEGIKNSRTFDPESQQWKASGSMTYGRWYPSLVTMPDGKVMAFSGVTKLIKPVYPDRPGDSGRNVTQSEVYDPATGTWKVDGGSKSLPLYPRMHLLPNGHVYYDAAGQTFNPSGQAYDEALWNTTASYDPRTRQWRDLGLPAFGPALVGFRGSSFSQMLPLRPNSKGEYDTAQFLSAGGVYGVSPGTYAATDTSTLNTVKTGRGGAETFTSVSTGPMTTPRWYSTAVTLPTGQVIAFSGADRDEVVAPGSGTPVTTPEMYDPATRTWTALTGAARGRTYHNTATLLPDGRVLVGGHAPISTGYAANNEVPSDVLGFSEPKRDPSFELFSPPNLFYGPRPVISSVPTSVRRGTTLTIGTPDARSVSSVAIARNTALTHLVDGDQRTVLLPVVGRTADSVTVKVTGNAAVLPDGPYNVFVNKDYAQGETPSVGRQVFVGAVPARFADDIAENTAAATKAELAGRDAAVRPARAAAAPAPAAAVAPAAAAPAGRPAVVRAAAARPVAAVEASLVSSPVRTGTSLPVIGLVALGLVGSTVVVRRVLQHGRTAATRS